jgi:hypothetical protein
MRFRVLVVGNQVRGVEGHREGEEGQEGDGEGRNEEEHEEGMPDDSWKLLFPSL